MTEKDNLMISNYIIDSERGIIDGMLHAIGMPGCDSDG